MRALSFLLAWSFCVPIQIDSFPLLAISIRRSVLVPWKTDPLQPQSVEQSKNTNNDMTPGLTEFPVIGWVEERRDSNAQTHQVAVTWNGREDTPSSVIVDLPYFEQADSLGSSLWPSSFVLSILSQSPAFQEYLAALAASNGVSKVMELGSGLGLGGVSILAGARAASANNVICRLTDNDEMVVKALSDFLSENNTRVDLLDWRDFLVSEDEDQTMSVDHCEKVDCVVAADVAYYYHLLRPLMDTARAHLRSNDLHDNESTEFAKASAFMVLGQANRESQWTLYHNIKDGCYNQMADRHEGPWPGRTTMLLYNLRMYQWRAVEDSNLPLPPPTPLSEFSGDDLDGTLPISFLLHEFSESTRYPLAQWDHVATREDEDTIEITF